MLRIQLDITTNLFVLIAITAGCAPYSEQANSDASIRNEKKTDFAVIAYYHGDTSDIRDYRLDGLTHIIYSFLPLDGGRLSISSEQQRNDIIRLVSLKQEYPDLQIQIALGGWGGCETCSDVFSSAVGREKFAASVRQLLTQYDLDGLDLDWEYPAIKGYPGHPFKPEDKQNFTLLVNALRAALGDEYELSFAAGAGPNFLNNSIEWLSVMALVDRVNMMTYDLVSGDGSITEHHSPLYSTPLQANSADAAVRYLIGVGVEPEKIVIGAAFYARVWEAVKAPDGDSRYRAAIFKEFVSFRDLEEHLSRDCVTHWDAKAQAAFCYDSNAGLFASYDDRRSVASKTRYAIKNGLGGIMFWQLAQDDHQNGLLSAITAARAGGSVSESE